jgi:hypothetical protein
MKPSNNQSAEHEIKRIRNIDSGIYVVNLEPSCQQHTQQKCRVQEL